MFYKLTSRFPREERFRLTSQMRRSSASIGAKVAEGCGKRGNAEFQRFWLIASGYASELDYQLLLAHDLQFLAETDYRRIVQSVSDLRRMLTSLLQKIDTERFVAKC